MVGLHWCGDRSDGLHTYDMKRWRIVAQWIVIHVMYYLGVSSRYLARHYQSATHSPSAHD
jgi:hypothetical protein